MSYKDSPASVASIIAGITMMLLISIVMIITSPLLIVMWLISKISGRPMC